ncbi:PREDICTED: phytolongin Phyl2.2 [Tarenaya hassleriana]|uniref:phytolongin Phyl2.2 n=1 Tax=Tarenaya hassleriana TaxID=28532 RepID=UPI00053C9562|nr:PREDICTED: phytolongin Phyl2.2 [Tarenaya hassleriana]
MISDPDLLFYACIAKGTVVLAELSSKEPGIEATALRCIENTPPNHSIFSHTVRERTYTVAIDDPFVYFAISDEDMEKSEGVWLLNRFKSTMEDLVKSGSIDSLDNLSSHCLQSELDPLFAEIVGGELGLDSALEESGRYPSMDSWKGWRAAIMPLMGNPLKVLKKKRLHTDTKDKDARDLRGDGSSGVLCKELRKGWLLQNHQARRNHVWMVLAFGTLICAVLFGAWMRVCQGSQGK